MNDVTSSHDNPLPHNKTSYDTNCATESPTIKKNRRQNSLYYSNVAKITRGHYWNMLSFRLNVERTVLAQWRKDCRICIAGKKRMQRGEVQSELVSDIVALGWPHPMKACRKCPAAAADTVDLLV